MNFRILDAGSPATMEPLTCARHLLEIQVGGIRLRSAIEHKLTILSDKPDDGLTFYIYGNLWPSTELTLRAFNAEKELIFMSENGESLAWISKNAAEPQNAEKITVDKESMIIKYPWDILALNEELLKSMNCDEIDGEICDGATINGHIKLGKGSVILPGVYIEGNAVIGENCKIGPNCYIRGSTSISDNCHVGQAVEIKNSILMTDVSAGHLSYIGDSIISPKTNLGAGTITANFRHDGKNHRSEVNGELVDTGRRKFGCVMGDNVHTGIHTSIYPGRKIWANMSTLPGDIVRKDLKPE